MKKWFQIPAMMALAFGAVTILAQETPMKAAASQEKDFFADAHALFCGNGKCEDAKCKDQCARETALLKAVVGKMMEQMKKEFGDKAVECCEKGEVKPCPQCRDMCKTMLIPAVKERNASRTKDAAKAFTHSVKDAAGKASDVPCTYLKDSCANCADELASAAVAKAKEMKSKETKK